MKKEAWYRSLISAYRRKKSQHLALQFSTILENLKDETPVIIICYNNGIYVKNITLQFNKFNIKPIIIDNKSSDKDTIETLKKLVNDEVAYVAYSEKNFGHFVGLLDPIYQQLPNYFAYTDPDLELNKNLPKTFIQDLIQLTQEYRVYKAGFALDLLDNENVIDVSQKVFRTKPFTYQKNFGVREYEDRVWRFPIKHKNLKAYCAPIDTTFAIYNKENFRGDFYDALRVAGNYSAVHLPWFPNLDIMNEKQKKTYLNTNRKKDTTWIKN